MSEFVYQFLSLDFPGVASALFASMSCALVGNYLLLRRMSLMGDAISHAVLPGIVVAFLLSGHRSSLVVFLGAAIAGIIAAVVIELIRKLGNLESSAAMGVVFSVMFAIGVLLMEQAAARNVDLDADCLLHGQLEMIFWYPPRDFASLFSWQTFSLLPSEVVTGALVFVLVVIFVALFYKELAICSFDAALASSLGFRPQLMHYLLMIVMASAVVASFEAVGSILVIAAIICPAACARFYTDKLLVQNVLSLLFAILSVVLGYAFAVYLPLWLGYANSLSAGGMITVMSGCLLAGSAVVAPRYGVLSKAVRRGILSRNVLVEDLLSFLYRLEESGSSERYSFDSDKVARLLGVHSFQRKISFRFAKRVLFSEGLVESDGESSELTDKGRQRAKQLVRTHRLWESFFVKELGLRPDHVHDSAEQLEHFTEIDLTEKLAEEQGKPERDPHGKEIP